MLIHILIVYITFLYGTYYSTPSFFFFSLLLGHLLFFVIFVGLLFNSDKYLTYVTCFCKFELSCPILEVDKFINLYIVLSCLIKEHSFLILFVSI